MVKDDEINAIFHWAEDACICQHFFVFDQVLSVVALVCLTSSGGDRGGYLRLPLSWHLRAFVFTCVAGMLMSLFTLFLNVSGAITMLPINWPFFVSHLLFQNLIVLNGYASSIPITVNSK